MLVVMQERTRGDVAFRNKWKELAKNQTTATRFKQAQHDFIQRTHHDQQFVIAKDTGINVCDGSHSNGLQDTVWSTAVQFAWCKKDIQRSTHKH